MLNHQKNTNSTGTFPLTFDNHICCCGFLTRRVCGQARINSTVFDDALWYLKGTLSVPVADVVQRFTLQWYAIFVPCGFGWRVTSYLTSEEDWFSGREGEVGCQFQGEMRLRWRWLWSYKVTKQNNAC